MAELLYNLLFIKIILKVIITLLFLIKNFIVVKELLKTPLLRINDITLKGTALHVACKNSLHKIVNLLLSYNSNPLYFCVF